MLVVLLGLGLGLARKVRRLEDVREHVFLRHESRTRTSAWYTTEKLAAGYEKKDNLRSPHPLFMILP